MKRFLSIISSISTISLLAVSCTSLPHVIEKGDLATAKKMVVEGADVNSGSDCFTPVTMAALQGDAELVKMLLDRGADVKKRSGQCDYTESIGPFKQRLRWGARTPLDRAKTAEIARMLIEKGARPDIGGYREYPRFGAEHDTALYNAVRTDNLELVRVLVEAGAPVNALNSSGKNKYLEITRVRKDKNPEAAKVEAYLRSKGAKDITLTDAMAAATDKEVLKEYRHIATGAVTVMSDEIAQALFDQPQRFGGLTMNAADNSYYHYSEFVWTKTGQNVYEWFLLRKKRKGALK